MRRMLVLFLLLMACDTPSRDFRESPAQRVTVEDSVFDVRLMNGRAEALRLNSEWAPRLSSVEPRARVAMEVVSGCQVIRLRGDQAMMIADLRCADTVPPPPPVEPIFCSIEEEPNSPSERVLFEVRCD